MSYYDRTGATCVASILGTNYRIFLDVPEAEVPTPKESNCLLFYPRSFSSQRVKRGSGSASKSISSPVTGCLKPTR